MISYRTIMLLIFSMYTQSNHAWASVYYIPVATVMRQTVDTDWLVVGAGPAGIITVGVLIDIGVPINRIIWLDPEFNVGRMGMYYGNVPANSKAQEFVDLVTTCNIFQEISSPEIECLKKLDLSARGYELNYIIQPLKQITDHLRTKVANIEDCLTSLYFTDDAWHVDTQQGAHITAHHIVLATGSHPRTLEHEQGNFTVLPLDLALDKQTLSTLVSPDDIIGIVGSSHSAILILMFLSEMNIKHIYNFYREPLHYIIDKPKEELKTTVPLKGIVAEWARDVLEKNPPANLTRIFTKDAPHDPLFKMCNKIIYAVGYERNDLPPINGITPIVSYNETNGFIAPRLFGIGIAFPECVTEPDGNQIHCISLDCFMEYAHRIIPQWLHDDVFKQAKTSQVQARLNMLKKSSHLFTIYAL